MERLTKRAENGLPYLAKVKDGETAVEGSYNTLKCIQEAFEALAKYEELEEQGQLLKLPAPLTELAKFEILKQYQEEKIVDVVRCEDCIKRDTTDCFRAYHDSVGEDVTRWVEDDDYCCYGESEYE